MIAPLIEIMQKLRDPEAGCEWDRKQNFRSIAHYTIEEAYEVVDAIDRGDMDDLRDELGDLLLQVVFHSQMASELGQFSFQDVVESICDKMERRHPHIFGDAQHSPGWEHIKAQERSDTGKSYILDGIAQALPSLMRAQKLQKRAALVGFDWPDRNSIRAKLIEELEELDEATTPDHVAEEMGDLLFAAVNLARFHKVDAEQVLEKTNQKFMRRFKYIEDNLDKPLEESSVEEMDTAWDNAKKLEQSGDL